MTGSLALLGLVALVWDKLNVDSGAELAPKAIFTCVSPKLPAERLLRDGMVPDILFPLVVDVTVVP